MVPHAWANPASGNQNASDVSDERRCTPRLARCRLSCVSYELRPRLSGGKALPTKWPSAWPNRWAEPLLWMRSMARARCQIGTACSLLQRRPSVAGMPGDWAELEAQSTGSSFPWLAEQPSAVVVVQTWGVGGSRADAVQPPRAIATGEPTRSLLKQERASSSTRPQTVLEQAGLCDAAIAVGRWASHRWCG